MTGRELDGYWQTVVNTLRDGIMIVNTRGAIVSVYRAFEQITGYSREELIGRSCEILHCVSCAQARGDGAGALCSFYRTEMAEQRRCQIRGRDGRSIQTVKNAAILKDPEKENQLEAIRKQLHSEDESTASSGPRHSCSGSST